MLEGKLAKMVSKEILAEFEKAAMEPRAYGPWDEAADALLGEYYARIPTTRMVGLLSKTFPDRKFTYGSVNSRGCRRGITRRGGTVAC